MGSKAKRRILCDQSKRRTQPSYDQQREGLAWRRKHEFGWPIIQNHDGTVQVTLGQKFIFKTFVTNDDDWSDIRYHTLDTEAEVRKLLDTYGHWLMVITEPLLTDDWTFMTCVLTWRARSIRRRGLDGWARFQCDV